LVLVHGAKAISFSEEQVFKVYGFTLGLIAEWFKKE
jgi:hypothetical protein